MINLKSHGFVDIMKEPMAWAIFTDAERTDYYHVVDICDQFIEDRVEHVRQWDYMEVLKSASPVYHEVMQEWHRKYDTPPHSLSRVIQTLEGKTLNKSSWSP